MEDVASIDATSPVRRIGDEHLLIILGSSVSGRMIEPIDLARLRMMEPLAPITLCLSPRDPLLLRLSEVAIAGIDRVLVLDGADTQQDLRRYASQALKYVLPSNIDLGVHPVPRDRGRSVALYCARNGYGPVTEGAIATAFACNRTQIWKSVKRSGWPDVQCLTAVARLLWVALEIQASSGGRASASRIARTLQFPSADALRKSVYRLTEHTWIDLTYGGAMRIVLDRWRVMRWGSDKFIEDGLAT